MKKKLTEGTSSRTQEGDAMYALAARLFPICRSITGNGVRETLAILGEYIPIKTYEVPTGTEVFDWTVPQEWNITDAYIEGPDGKRFAEFTRNNLHVVGYSIPVDVRLPLAELQEHLYSIEEQQGAIPYVTSYYKKRWGFCISHSQRASLEEGTYHAVIKSSLTKGLLTYGELILRGRSDSEILLSTYICHPSLANDNLSGIVAAVYLAKWLMESRREYTYRILFLPETIGSLAYLSRHADEMKTKTQAGFVLTCMGDDRAYSYLPSRAGDTLADRVALHVLSARHPGFVSYSYLDRGSDERQYCSPGVDLPVASIMRSKYGEYPEYHTSLDDLSVITPSGLQGSFGILKECIEVLEANRTYRATCLGEPQLGKRGLYPTLSQQEFSNSVFTLLNVLAYADGSRDVLAIAEKVNVPALDLIPLLDRLRKEKLLVAVQ